MKQQSPGYYAVFLIVLSVMVYEASSLMMALWGNRVRFIDVGVFLGVWLCGPYLIWRLRDEGRDKERGDSPNKRDT